MDSIFHRLLIYFSTFTIIVAFYGVIPTAKTASAQSQPPSPVTRIVAPINSPNANRADYLATGKDDDRVINQALSSLPPQGGRVLLQEGTYHLSTAIILNSNVSLAGIENATQLVLAVNANTVAITNSEPVTGNHNITIENLRIMGNKAFQNLGSGIYFRRVTSSILSNVEVKEARNSGIDLLLSSNNNILKNIKVLSNGNNGLVISDSNYNKVSILLADGNGDGGLWIVNSEQNVFSDIYTFNNKFSGIELEGSNNSLTGVITANNIHSGVYLTQASGNYIQGTAYQNTLSGFALNTSRGNTLQVWAVANGGHGLDLYNSSMNVIVNSIIRNNGMSRAGFNGMQISDDGIQPSHYNMILTSSIWDDQASKSQEFAIKVSGSADYLVIVGNNLAGNKYGPLSAEPRHSIMLNNTPAIP